MEDTIFMKIIRREIPAEIVYEDDDTLAFLDIKPTTIGHTLVIPKKPFQNIFDVDEETLSAVMRTVRKISPAVRDAVGAHGVHINSNHGEAAGQIVNHLHFHIIPRHSRDEFEFWPQNDYSNATTAAEIAEKIRAKLV
jgi:histidine triad (HIT) family protein